MLTDFRKNPAPCEILRHHDRPGPLMGAERQIPNKGGTAEDLLSEAGDDSAKANNGALLYRHH